MWVLLEGADLGEVTRKIDSGVGLYPRALVRAGQENVKELSGTADSCLEYRHG
jgi:hypothetical protein